MRADIIVTLKVKRKKKIRGESSINEGDNHLGLENLNQNRKSMGSNGLGVLLVTYVCYNNCKLGVLKQKPILSQFWRPEI